MSGTSDEPKTGFTPPPRGDVAQVFCGGLKHLAYRDWRGQWRSFINGQTLEGNVRVIEFPQGPPRGHIQLNLFR